MSTPRLVSTPLRGEIWLVRFEPSVGAEMGKSRPALVLSRDDVGKLPLRVVVPVTIWQQHFQDVPWLVAVEASAPNGLDRKSVADCFQPRSFDIGRFVRRLGVLEPDPVEVIARTVAAALGVSTGTPE